MPIHPPRTYFLHCTHCGWERLDRAFSGQPGPLDKVTFENRFEPPTPLTCPKCGSKELEFRSANNLKGQILKLLKGY